MNLKEIRDDVRSLIIEPTPGFRTDAELNKWINQAHQELGMLYGLETKISIPITAGQIFYTLPDDFLKLLGVWDHRDVSLPIASISFGSVDYYSDKRKILVMGNQIAVIPVVNNVAELPRITVFYERKPRMLVADSDVPEIPEPYHRLLVAYAVMRALQKDEDYEAASAYSQEYEFGRTLISSHKILASREIQMVLDLVQRGILNSAEAAVMLNLPLKDKIWNRVEVEEKGLLMHQMGVMNASETAEYLDHPLKEKIKNRIDVYEKGLELHRLRVTNAAETAKFINLEQELQEKIWNRVEVEEKGMALLYAGAISKADLIKNTAFTDREEIQKRLQHKLTDFAHIPGWEVDADG